ncbi:hypothetical protein [Actinoalloteichus fjordicus]|uniref:hypothetical protein n=1 Tax=Actinoalloteichus fjordicus TaxID=1612552 RepID=UPI0012F83155|nr:hypothetical protein [Actinoalloteichus fjordicus]
MTDAYELDPEKLPQAIADLEAAYIAAQALLERSRDMALIRPGNGVDEVSDNAAVQLNRLADDPTVGSLAATGRGLTDAISETRAKFKRMLADYLELEDVNQLPDYDLSASEVPQATGYWERQAAHNGRRDGNRQTAV